MLRKKILYTTFFIALILYTLVPLQIKEDAPLQIYAGQCDDDFSSLLCRTIKQAKHSVFLSIYSLSDPDIIAAIQAKIDMGLKVRIIVDKKNPLPRLKGIEIETVKTSGLMHRKILVIDDKIVAIGSANFTGESLHFDDNLLTCGISPTLASKVVTANYCHTCIGGQEVEFFPIPEEKEFAFRTVCQYIDEAKRSLFIAMFTWTHPILTEKIIAAQKRGVKVTCVIDRRSASGTSVQAFTDLVSSGLATRTHKGGHTFHHKFALIDEKTLLCGSVNWTRSAFSKNVESLLIIHDLTHHQLKKIKRLQHAILATSQRSPH